MINLVAIICTIYTYAFKTSNILVLQTYCCVKISMSMIPNYTILFNSIWIQIKFFIFEVKNTCIRKAEIDFLRFVNPNLYVKAMIDDCVQSSGFSVVVFEKMSILY